ncbi:MAG: preprotein translocase subunit YajC [Alphaproteobacteria bacterium]|nr:preprotein translocase subunit YajC [Alphaproteobacteria bacterium]
MQPLDSAPSTLHEQVLVTHDPAAAAPGGALLTQLPLLIAIVAIFYFLIIRPQNQERKRHEELLGSLKRDDDVITGSGMHGRVVAVHDTVVEIEIAPKVRIKVEKSAVQRRAGDPDPKASSGKGN